MHLAFTGTKDGVTPSQGFALSNIFHQLRVDGYYTMHNGDCIGSDAFSAHMWKYRNKGNIVLHPPTNPKYRAWIDFADVMMPEGDYIKRDHDMVDLSSILVGTPKCEEYLRSGTWSTIRYARKIGIPRILIYPDGSIVKEEGSGLANLI